MPRDYFAEEIEGGSLAATRDYFEEEVAPSLRPSAIPDTEATESIIRSRGRSPLSSFLPFPLPTERGVEGAEAALTRAVPLPFPLNRLMVPRIREALTAAPMVAQGRDASLGETLRETGEALLGQRRVETGDIFRSQGAGEVASAVGGMALQPETIMTVAAGVPAAARGIARLSGNFRLGRLGTIAKPNPERVAQLGRIREGILQAPKLAGEEFEGQLAQLETAHPGQTVDLSTATTTLQEALVKNPSFRALWDRAVKNSKVSAKVQSIVNQPEVSRTVTLREAQEVKRVLSQALKTKFQQVSPELFDAHLDALDAWHSIRQAEVNAFEEFNDIAQGYHQVLSKFRTIKPALKEGALEPTLLSDFGRNTEKAQALRDIITPETLKLILQLKGATGMRKLLLRAGLVGGAALTPPGQAGIRYLLSQFTQ